MVQFFVFFGHHYYCFAAQPVGVFILSGIPVKSRGHRYRPFPPPGYLPSYSEKGSALPLLVDCRRFFASSGFWNFQRKKKTRKSIRVIALSSTEEDSENCLAH